MAITYNTTPRTINYIYRATGGGVNFSANLAGQAAFDYFPDDAVVNDAIYFAGPNYYAWSDILLNVGTAFAAASFTIVWEYYQAPGAGWKALEGLQDDTNSFQNIGANVVRFPYQWLWYYGLNINGKSTLWIRARISAVAGITEGGANQTTAPSSKDGMVNIDGYTDGAPCSFSLVTDYLATNYAYLGTLKHGSHFDFRSIGLKINSRLKSRDESVESGNVQLYHGSARQNWDYLESGIKLGDASGVNGSAFYIGGRANTYPTTFGANTKAYGSSFLSPNGSAGYPSLRGEWLDNHIDMIPHIVSPGTFRNNRFRIGGLGFMSYTPTVFLGNKVILGQYVRYMYQNGCTFEDLDYEFQATGIAMFYLYQTYSDIAMTMLNPKTPMPSQASQPYMIRREMIGQRNIHSFLNYDNTSGFTDQTAEAQDATADDVNLTGKTGAPEVGDCLYLRTYNVYSPYPQRKSFEVTMGSVVNADNEYAWEVYTAAGWKPATMWDCTKNFTQSGKIYIAARSTDGSLAAVTIIDGISGTWARARITVAGTSKPLATKIRSAQENGISNWHAYEKYSFDLKVVDAIGDPVAGATVTVKNAAGAGMFSVNTGADGKIAQQVLTKKTWYFDPVNFPAAYCGVAEVTEGNYALDIKAAGRQGIETEFALAKKIDWEIALARFDASIAQVLTCDVEEDAITGNTVEENITCDIEEE